MRLIIERRHFNALLEHARDGYPDEVCGLIGGRDEVATTVARIPNVASTPRVRFEMDRRIMVETIIGFQRAGLDVVAIYHSHPAGGFEPSRTDIAEAAWPDAICLIVDVSDQQAPRVGAWAIQRGKANSAVLEIRES